MRLFLLVCAFDLASSATAFAQAARSGNPILPGWYADPEAHVFAGQYWIFPTYSAPYDQQTYLDAFSSRDLITWERHARVLAVSDVSWARRAVWAPSIVEKDGWYYLFFGANDIQNDLEVGGIGIARSRQPEGPFKDYLGKPLIDKFHNGAQPIDQNVFKDTDGTYYIVYGGWRHCNIAKLDADFTGFIPFPDGSTFKEITPAGYVEGAYMLLKDGKYYFMWSEGGWTGPNYAVAYAIGSTPFGPFERVGRILQQDSTVATGAGHHSVLQSPASNQWYIVYHRRPLGETNRNHRAVSIDQLRFDERGFILPVKITNAGVPADPLGAAAPRASLAQQAKIPIRAVSAPLAATTAPLKAVGEGVARELPDGRLLVNAGIDRQLLLYDASLARATVLADTASGAAMAYSFAPRLVPFLGDSTLLFDLQSRSLMLIGPTGATGRVMATPTPAFNGFGPGGGIDSRGRLVYAQLGAPASLAPCTPGATVAPATAADSGIIVRADFETRTVDTIGRNRGAIPGSPNIIRDSDCKVVSVRWPVNPMLPSVDTWTMTSNGVLAIVRGRDYHMDWVHPDGRRTSSPKMPFDWRRLTDDDKQAKIDSARKVIDSVTAAGGYRARVCGGNLAGLMLAPIQLAASGASGGGDAAAGGRGGGGAVRGGGGGGSADPAVNADCKWIVMPPAFPSLSEMPDYIPPIRQVAPKADVDGNVWILPTTSLAAKDGLLYDVVNARGELVERVQLPADRDIVAFGRGGVLYLSRREAPNRVFVERVKVIRQ